MDHPTVETAHHDTAQLMEQILYEVKRVVVGQDRFLERVMVAAQQVAAQAVHHKSLRGTEHLRLCAAKAANRRALRSTSRTVTTLRA